MPEAGGTARRSSSAREAKPKSNPRLVGVARDAAISFINGDGDGSGELSYAEFLQIMPARMRESEEDLASMREVFRAIRVDNNDKDGGISMKDFFIFTLYLANDAGSGLEVLFRTYDLRGTGVLDSHEFALAVEDMGFGGISHDLFLALDQDGSGEVSYIELLHVLRSRSTDALNRAKRIFSMMATETGLSSGSSSPASGSRGSPSKATGVATDLKVDEWKLTAVDAGQLLQQVQRRLAQQGWRASDLYRWMVTDRHDPAANLGSLSRKAFVGSMLSAGFQGEEEVLHHVFDRIDEDRSNAVGLVELSAWINDRLGRKQTARSLRLRNRGAGAIPLDNIEWTPEAIRMQIQLMLITADLAPLDLVRSWDSGERDCAFSLREFLSMMKALTDDNNLWDWHGLRDCAKETYTLVSNGKGPIDLMDFERWLNDGWKELKANPGAQTLARKKRHPRMALPSSPTAFVRTTSRAAADPPLIGPGSPFRPTPLVRSESNGLWSTSIRCASAPNLLDKSQQIPSWMQPVKDNRMFAQTLTACRSVRMSKSTLHRLARSRTSPQLSSPGFPASVATRRRSASRQPFIPLSRPVVTFEAMRCSASLEAEMAQEAADAIALGVRRAQQRTSPSLTSSRSASGVFTVLGTASRGSLAPSSNESMELLRRGPSYGGSVV
jgi:hypothetical protein